MAFLWKKLHFLIFLSKFWAFQKQPKTCFEPRFHGSIALCHVFIFQKARFETSKYWSIYGHFLKWYWIEQIFKNCKKTCFFCNFWAKCRTNDQSWIFHQFSKNAHESMYICSFRIALFGIYSQDTGLSIRENAAQNEFVKVVFGGFWNSQNFHKNIKKWYFFHKNVILYRTT